MDLDAVITFKRVLNEKNITTADKMLLASAINNANININLSIRDNLKLIDKNGISLEELFLYLKEFIGNDDEYLDVPIYMLFLEKKDLWNLLLAAYKIANLSEESLLIIGKNIFKYLDSQSNSDTEELIQFFNNLLSVKRPNNYKLFQASFSTEPFVYSNLDDIYNGSNKANKLLLVTLISFGYIDLSLLSLAVGNDYSYVESFIKELLDHKLYGYVKIFINAKTVNEDLALIIKEIISNYSLGNEENYRLEQLILILNSKLDNIIEEKKTLNRH